MTFSGATTRRFWTKVNKTDTCWEWTAFLDKGGYGTFKIDRKNQRAHRISYTLHKGDIPPGQVVMHMCDNPKCVNPAHLTLGTLADNNRDMKSKGRMVNPVGTKHGQSKLNNNQVQEIRSIYAQGNSSMQSLADKYGITLGTIHPLLTRKTWRHI